MAKVDWISWKTETDEIINPEKIFEEVSTIYNEFKNNIDKEVKSKLLDEIANGGLNENEELSSEDEYSYQEETEKYGARNNEELADLQ